MQCNVCPFKKHGKRSKIVLLVNPASRFLNTFPIITHVHIQPFTLISKRKMIYRMKALVK
jgi:hypothetical protein